MLITQKINSMNKKLLLITFFVLFILASCKVGRFFIYNFADIKDHKKFHAREVKRDTDAFQFTKVDQENAPKTITLNQEKQNFESFLKDNKTVAFLIIRNDTIQYENYFYKYDKASIVPSFSMAKSIVSILIGIAIDEGKIQSVNEPITNYIPELIENGFDKVTIEHLLQMTSGLDFNESYFNPFGHAATYYYGTRLRKEITKLKLAEEPETSFNYTSGETQLLGLVLERAIADKTISAYLEEKLWKPLEMEYDASWSIDRKKNGLEKAFCCVNARARDFAKLGRLYLNKGNWNGNQIVSKEWINQSVKVDETKGSKWYYQYQWWLPTTSGDFMAQGILGQYIYVNPEKNLIIVRLGKKTGKTNWWNVFPTLARLY